MKIVDVTNKALVVGSKKELEKIKEALFFKVNMSGLGFDVNKTIVGYEEAEGGLLIPRAMFEAYKKVKEANWEKVEIPFYGELRDYQKEYVNVFMKQGGNGIICAETGLGKTVMALYLAHKIGLKTLVIVPTDALFKQWIQRIKKFCGFYPTTIRGSYCDISTPIVVGMLKTLAMGKRINREALIDKFGFTIYDEVHRVPTDKFNVVAGWFWDKYRLGLSATPKRKDYMHTLIEYHIGKVIKLNTSISGKLIPIVYAIYYNDYECSGDKCYKRGDFILPLYYKKISQVKERNLLIASYAKYGYDKGRYVMILADRLKLLQAVKTYLIKLGIRKDDIGYLTGNKKVLGRRIILATYGSGGEGVDIPELDYIIFATPRADIRQALGRALRPKNRRPVIIDIVDCSCQVMLKFFRKRNNTYKGMGAEVKDLLVNKAGVYKIISKLGGEKWKI